MSLFFSVQLRNKQMIKLPVSKCLLILFVKNSDKNMRQIPLQTVSIYLVLVY